MSEYWKSTPNYWCKFCKTYVRDTPLERKNHESTPRHQSSIQRSLRELHKNTEREERDKQRAKDEVARLNGLVGGKPVAGSSAEKSALKSTTAPAPAPAPRKPASVEERKRQMEQLAAMGVAIPEEYRKDLSIAGGWSVVSETPIYKKEADDDEDSKAAVFSFGVRKRKLDEEEEEAEAALRATKNRAWGSRLKSYPGAGAAGDDLDALLSGPIVKKGTVKKEDGETKEESADKEDGKVKTEDGSAPLKAEDAEDKSTSLASIPDINDPAPAVPVKQEEQSATDPPVVFKKRKAKR